MVVISAFWPLQHDLSEPQIERRVARRVPCTRAQRDGLGLNDFKVFARGEELAAVGQTAILHGTRDQVEVGAWQARPSGIEITLSITNDRDRRGLGKHLLGCKAGAHPSPGFFVFKRALLMRNDDAAFAGPNTPRDRAKAAAAVGIQRP